jgi:hypothetical protein
MNRSRPSFLKREKEKARKERQQKKNERRQEASARKAAGTPGADEGEDPDIAGIRLGPQPPPEE